MLPGAHLPNTLPKEAYMADLAKAIGVLTAEDFLEIARQRRQFFAAHPEEALKLEGNPHGNPIQIGQALPTVEEWVDDMVTGAKNNSSRWKRKALRPRKNPLQAALAAKEKYLSNMKASLDAGTWEASMGAAKLEDYANGIEMGGESRYSSGIDKGRQKATRKIGALRAYMLETQDTVDSMPVGSKEERNAKVLANLERMRAAKTAVIERL